MHVPPAFQENNLATLHGAMREARLANLVTATAEGLIATPLPMFLVPEEGAQGTLYGHLSRANPQWRLSPCGEAMALFMGPHAYVTPSWYPSKREHGKVVPTWNYVAVHAYGPIEFFEDYQRLLQIVTRLTDLHEDGRDQPWAVSDAPDDYIRAQLGGIIGFRLPIGRIIGKQKLSQNRTEQDRAGVAHGLAGSERASDRDVGAIMVEKMEGK